MKIRLAEAAIRSTGRPKLKTVRKSPAKTKRKALLTKRKT